MKMEHIFQIFPSMILFIMIFPIFHAVKIVGHIVPHSHCDPGWKVPEREYYNQNVSKIFRSVISEMAKISTRKFIWSEIVFFKEFWENNATDEEKTILTKLVKEERFEFVGGGWVQNDEAITDYVSIIDQMQEGSDYLKRIFDIFPNIAWQIDPFGHSKLFPHLLKMMGFHYLIINRVDDRLKFKYSDIPASGKLRELKSFQFFWKFKDEYSEKSRMNTEILFNHYSSPIGFDFEGNSKINPEITKQNIFQRCNYFINEVIKKRTSFYRFVDTFHVLIPFGDDFRFQNATKQFANIDRIIHQINNNKTYGNIFLRYSTLSNYYENVYEQIEKYKKQEKKDLFPTLSTDFFPYARCFEIDKKRYNNCVTYWTGFYSSYPYFLKSYVRDMKRFLRVSESLLALAKHTYLPDYKFLKYFQKVESFRREISLAQHHDAITGTCLPSAKDDWVKRMTVTKQMLNEYVLELVSLLLSKSGANFVEFFYNIFFKWGVQENSKNLVNVAANPFQIESKFNFNDEKKEKIVVVAVYNSLGFTRKEYINITLPKTEIVSDVLLVNLLTNRIESVRNYEIVERENNFEVFILVKVPPLGFRSYFLKVISSSASSFSNINVVKEESCSKFEVLENNQIKLTFKDFFLSKYERRSIFNDTLYEESLDIKQNFFSYISYSDDSYSFRPKYEAEEIIFSNIKCSVVNGKLIKEIKIENVKNKHNTFNIMQYYRIYEGFNSSFINQFVDYNIFSQITKVGFELVTRFTTSINTTKNIFHDINGFDEIEREFFESKFGDSSIISKIASNYYPMAYFSYITDQREKKCSSFLILTRSAYGVSSQKEGSIEIMLNRNTNGSYPGQINTNVTNFVSPSSFLLHFFDRDKYESELWKRKSKSFEYPFFLFYSIKFDNIYEYLYKYLYERSDLEDLERNVHLMSFKNYFNGSTILRLQNLNDFVIDESHLKFTQKNIINVNEVVLTLKSEKVNSISPSHSLKNLEIKTLLIDFKQINYSSIFVVIIATIIFLIAFCTCFSICGFLLILTTFQDKYKYHTLGKKGYLKLLINENNDLM